MEKKSRGEGVVYNNRGREPVHNKVLFITGLKQAVGEERCLISLQSYYCNYTLKIFFTVMILMISRDLGNLLAKRQNYTCVLTAKLTSFVISKLNKHRASPYSYMHRVFWLFFPEDLMSFF